MVYLCTERLIIRDHNLDDLEAMHSLMSCSEVMHFLHSLKTNSLEETEHKLIASINESQQIDRTKYFFAIEDRSSSKYIGEIGFTVSLDTQVGKIVDLGYFILPEFWGKGIITEAAKEVIRFAFEDLDVIKVEAGCISDNSASEAVMMKIGMKQEGHLRLKVWHDNSLKDRLEYGILKEEWLMLKGSSA